MACWNGGLLPIYDIKLLLNSFCIQLIWQKHTNASVKEVNWCTRTLHPLWPYYYSARATISFHEAYVQLSTALSNPQP